ncbi:MAG: hypothetical protein AB2754_19695 [Candidatus Thiodiazotropha endolucinida]
MAIVYRVKDGPHGGRTDEGKEISILDLTEKLENHTCQYLTEKPPQFNSKEPSDYFRHIVIGVSDVDELNNKFPKKGFYVVVNLDVANSEFLYQ